MSLIEAITSLIVGEQGTKGMWEKQNRFMSFSPERDNCHVKWYVDAKDYFHAVSEALMSAKEEIFIEDLWLTPELYLRRPPAKNEEYRLDRILKKKAEEGVRIYVVVYKEMSQTATYASKHSKSTLQGLHKNILVQRHPNHTKLEGLIWTHHEKIVVIDRHTSFIGGLDLCFGRYDTSVHQLADFHDHSRHYSIWPGQDYSNPRIRDFVEVENWAKTLVDKKQTARMPWHDIAVGFIGRPTFDVARHFVQRWNFIKKYKAENRDLYPLLIAKSDEQSDREHPPQVRSYHYSNGEISCHPDKGTCHVQILRSVSNWSHGLDETERSIQNAYINVIGEAKHFVYIENQYFITSTNENSERPVKNLIGKAIVDRITRAYKNHEQFKIIVTIPLFVAYQGDIDSNEGATVRLILHHQHESIRRGEESIFGALEKNGVINPENYIGFYSLRTYDKIKPKSVKNGLGILEDELKSLNSEKEETSTEIQANIDSDAYVTEELYIHSKLLIADDRIVICGSANVNDRSQNGDGDSEIATIVEDKDYINSKMAGKDWKAGRFAATLRRRIFKEHLGLLNESDHEKVNTLCSPPPLPHDERELSKEDQLVLDPASDEFYFDIWKKTATINTDAFQKVFHCVPDNTVTNWEDYKSFIPNRLKVPAGHVYDPDKLTKEEVEAELSKVKGHLVHYPLEFMNKEKLTIFLESVIPSEIYKAFV